MGLLDSVRAFVILVIAATLVLTFVRYVKLIRHFSRSLQLFMWAMFFLLVTVAWDTGVLIANADPFSWRMLPLAIGLSLLVIALAEPRDAVQRRYGHKPDELNRDIQLRAALIENQELNDKLYEALRRENVAATRYQLTRIELDQANRMNETLRREESDDR